MATKEMKGNDWRRALARFDNPYAFIDYDEAPYVRHPYAYASLEIPDAEQEHYALAAAATSAPVPVGGRCTKLEFRGRCRAIFSGYMPAPERGKLRDHHRAFILRNESRSPEQRFRLLAELAKYDLSSHVGLTGQFNRERDVFTEEKLLAIESAIEKETK